MDDVDPAALRGNEAVTLFVDRVQAVKPDFDLSAENASAVAEICRRLDGLPFALELAAGRMASLTAPALATRLRDRLLLLAHGPRDADARQQTLRQTIDWSYDLLTQPERQLFAELGVFAGGARLDAIDAVCTHRSSDPLDLLDSLVSKSLLIALARGDSDAITAAAIKAESYATQIHDACEVAFARNTRALGLAFVDANESLQLQQDAAARLEASDEAWVAAVALLNLGWIQLLNGDRESARATLLRGPEHVLRPADQPPDVRDGR